MEPTPQKHPKFVRWALLIGIVVILNVFFFVIEQIAFPSPVYNDYCPQPTKQAQTQASCEAQDGVWTEYPPQPVAATAKEPVGYCDYYIKCQPVYDQAQQEQHLSGFVLMTILGIVALVVGVIPIGSSIVSSGLSYGGVLALIVGSMQYWGDAGQWLRLAISAVALIALIGVGIRRFKD